MHHTLDVKAVGAPGDAVGGGAAAAKSSDLCDDRGMRLVALVLVCACSHVAPVPRGAGPPPLAIPEAGAAPPEPIEMAVTFDDLPAAGPAIPGVSRLQVHREILTALRKHRVPQVYGFVNGRGAQDADGKAALSAWVEAGYPLGNHTFSHGAPKEVPAYLADVDRNEPLLRELQPGDEARWDPVYRDDPRVAPTAGDILQEQVATARRTPLVPWVAMPLKPLDALCR